MESNPLCSKSRRPVVAQIDGYLAAFGGGRFSAAGEHVSLELQHLRLIKLEDDCPFRPCQPVGARVQAGRRNHDLAHTRVGRVIEVVVEELGACGLVVDEVPAELGHQLVLRRLAVENVGPLAADCPAEDLRVRVDDQRVRFVRLQRSGGGDEQTPSRRRSR